MKKIILYGSLAFFTKNLLAQDSNYWMQQFGSRSALLGGAVAGGVRDNSAVIYNPGALAFIDSNSISVSGNGYQYSMLKLQNGAGTNLDLKSNRAQTIPLMISGMYRFKKHPKHFLGFTVMQKQQTGFSMTARNHTTLQNPDSLGQEEYVGQYDIKSSLNEIWAGISYAYHLNKHISLGITNFIAYRRQSLNEVFIARAFMLDTIYSQHVTPEATSDDITAIQFSNVRDFAKIGLSLDYGKLKLGITITTPGINLGGGSIVSADNSATDVNESGISLASGLKQQIDSGWGKGYGNYRNNYLYSYTNNDRQPASGQKIKTIYKSPLSVAGGIEYTIGKTTIMATAEWFQAISSYNLETPLATEFALPANAQYGQTSDQFLRIREGAISVTNFAFGIEQSVTKSFSLLASFRTDFSSYAADDSIGLALSQTYWDLYHVTLGSTIKQKRSDFSIGLSYTFGNTTDSQWVNLTEPTQNGNGNDYLQGNLQNTTTTFHSYALILGYTYHLK
jgi:hypothetical protein